MHPVPASITVRVKVAFYSVGVVVCLDVERHSAIIQIHSIHVILKIKTKPGITKMPKRVKYLLQTLRS